GVVAEIAADGDNPAVLALKQNRPVAPVWLVARDHHRDLAAELAGMAAVEPRRVADADIDPLLLRPRIAESVQPGGRERAAARRIHHEIGLDGVLLAAAQADPHTLDRGTVFARNQAQGGAILDRPNARQRQQPAPDMSLQH